MSFRGYIRSSQVIAAGGATAGVCAGMLGLSEAIYYSSSNPGSMIYAFGLYAILGILYGSGIAVFFGGKARKSQNALSSWAGRMSAWLIGFLVLFVWGFLVYRDVWNESIAVAEPFGWAIMLGVLVAALICAFIVKKTAGFLASRAEVMIMLLIPIAVIGILLGRVVEKGSETTLDFAGKKNDQRPAILFVVVDALRIDEANTPHLNKFRKDAVDFSNAWACASWTRPSVASILSGLYPDSHQTIYKTDRLPNNIPTLATVLKKSGYATIASVTNVNLAPVFGFGRGFDNWSYLSPQPFLLAPPSAGRLFVVEIYRWLKLKFFPGQREAESYYARGERVVDRAKELIKPLAKANAPFFAYLHFMEPHDPYFAHPYDGHAVARVENPNPTVDRADEILDLYRQEIRHFDDIFGKLIDYLKRSGLYKDSMIVFTSDHGEEFADHGGFWHGTSLYEELIHVPLMIRFPGGVGAGSARNEPVSQVDLMPTALEFAQVENKVKTDGSSLVSDSVASDRYLYASIDHQGCVMRCIRKGRWKLITANADNPRNQPVTQLYDLETDSKEQTNLADKESKLAAELKSQLASGSAAASARLRIEAQKTELDPQTQEQLRSLGYTD